MSGAGDEPAADLEAALGAVPVFPLRNVVLFPRAILPLHVFEPRYRTMLADSLATHRCLAMAQIVDGERFATVAGVGAIVRHQALPDGRSNILLLGRARVSLEELPLEASYRRARARVLEDTPCSVPEVDRASLHAAAAAFVAEVRRQSVEIEFRLPPGLDAAGAVDLCAHHLVVDAAARQRALEELDVVARVLLVTTELAAQTSRLVGERGGGPN